MIKIAKLLPFASLAAFILWVLALFHGFSSNYIFCFDSVRNEGCGSSIGFSGPVVLWLAPLVIIVSIWLRVSIIKAYINKENRKK